MAARCTAITKGGTRCTSPVLPDSRHCWTHDPAAADRRREASVRGGRARSNVARAAKAMPAALTSDDLLVTLSRAIEKVEKGQLEPGPANAISSLAWTMNSIRETTEIERRLSELEQKAGISEKWRA